MEILSNTEAGLKKGVAYKKSVYTDTWRNNSSRNSRNHKYTSVTQWASQNSLGWKCGQFCCRKATKSYWVLTFPYWVNKLTGIFSLGWYFVGRFSTGFLTGMDFTGSLRQGCTNDVYLCSLPSFNFIYETTECYYYCTSRAGFERNN